MIKIEGVCKEVMEKTEFVAIVTWNGTSPHLVGTWGAYVNAIGIKDDKIIVPAGHYNKTEENLKENKNIQLLIGSRSVAGKFGHGQGCVIHGEGEIQKEGEFAKLAKEKFAWARGALVIQIKKIETHL